MAHAAIHRNADPKKLLNGLTDESPAVRIAAARSLYEFDQHRNTVAAELTQLLRHPQVSVRHAAALTVDEVDGLDTQLQQEVSEMNPADKYVKSVVQHILER